MKNQKRGVTLVEIAIVLVIIGLLLGGVLKGQELINNAKVRSIADRQSSLKVAWYSFIDRFQALPGDYVYAESNIQGAKNGDGNGVIVVGESPKALQHMTAAGYLRCPQCDYADSVDTPPTANNSLQNQYGGVMSVWHDGTYYATIGGPSSARLMVHTGPRIPSNIIAEVDRKLDDGVANRGDFVFNEYDPQDGVGGAAMPDEEECMAKVINPVTAGNAEGGTKGLGVDASWRGALAVPPVEQNCGASVSI